MTGDSAQQYDWASRALDADRWQDVVISTSYPPLMSFMIAGVIYLTGAVWLVAWLQYFCFALATGLLLTALLQSARRAVGATAALFLLPPVWGLVPVVESTIWNAAALEMILAAMLLSGTADRWVRRAVLALAALALVVLFGFRYNTLPLAVPILKLDGAPCRLTLK